MIEAESWNYFLEDTGYATVLADRLRDGVEMDSAIGLAAVLQEKLRGDQRILDFGSGPGHYLPVLRKLYTNGSLSYRGIDILPSSVETGNAHFASDPTVSLEVGSALDPASSYQGENCIISANTLPHIPSIEPFFGFIRETPSVSTFAVRMLIGQECIQSRKHLSESSFDDLFEAGYQFNNIYNERYLRYLLGDAWNVEVSEDHVNPDRLREHSIPRQKTNAFYGNRVSRLVGEMTFKGDLYMPWKYVFGRRIA
jgi:hypothetical protein